MMLVFHVAGTVPTLGFSVYRATLLLASGAHYLSGFENYKNYTHMLSGEEGIVGWR
jgi:hypothetical protein